MGRCRRHSRPIPQHNVTRQIRCCQPNCSSGSVLSMFLGQCPPRAATNHTVTGYRSRVKGDGTPAHSTRVARTVTALTRLFTRERCYTKGLVQRGTREESECAHTSRTLYYIQLMMSAAVLARRLIGTC